MTPPSNLPSCPIWCTSAHPDDFSDILRGPSGQDEPVRWHAGPAHEVQLAGCQPGGLRQPAGFVTAADRLSVDTITSDPPVVLVADVDGQMAAPELRRVAAMLVLLADELDAANS